MSEVARGRSGTDIGERSRKADLGRANGTGQDRRSKASQYDEAGVYQQAGRDVLCGSEKERIEN
jgi:hypothetical protein